MAKKQKAKPKPAPGKEKTAPGLPMMVHYRAREGKMSQEALAAKVGVTQGMISQWEKGTSDVPLGMVHKLAKALNTTAFGLQFRNPFKQEEDIFAAWQRVLPEHRERALRLLADFSR